MRFVGDNSWDFVDVCLKALVFCWFVLLITFLVVVTKIPHKSRFGWKGSFWLTVGEVIVVEVTVHELEANAHGDRKSESRGSSAGGQARSPGVAPPSLPVQTGFSHLH